MSDDPERLRARVWRIRGRDRIMFSSLSFPKPNLIIGWIWIDGWMDGWKFDQYYYRAYCLLQGQIYSIYNELNSHIQTSKWQGLTFNLCCRKIVISFNLKIHRVYYADYCVAIAVILKQNINNPFSQLHQNHTRYYKLQ